MDNQHQPDGPRPSNLLLPSPEPCESPPHPPKVELIGFARQVVVAVLITVLILAIAYFLWRGVHVLLQAFAGVLFAVFLAALSDWLSKHTNLSYRWSLAVVVLGLFLITGGVWY